MIGQAFAWWVVIELIGLVALPITLTAFANLPGRGYAFAKPLGLLLAGYLFWLALSAHVLPNRPGSVAWVLIFIAAVSALLFWRRKDQLIDAVRQNLPFIIVVEVVFALTFFTAGHLKSFIPEISGTEKPMDLMFLNAADRSRYYPPADAWLAGFDVSYYYFGYVIQAMVGKLAFLPTAVTFNLALASTAALAATAAFGLAYELVRSVREVAFKTALLVGGAALVLVTLMGNLEGAVEFGIANDAVGSSVVNRLDIANLETAQASDACLLSFPACIEYPNEQSSHWWWWRATRISPDANSITEFPFFSFLLGDLHPHVMAIPFVFTVVGLALAFYRTDTPLSADIWRRRPALLLLSAVLLGGLGFLNTWDLPTFTFLIALLVVIRNRNLDRDVQVPWNLLLYLAGKLQLTSSHRRQSLSALLTGSWSFLLPLIALALIFYTPFYLSFHTQADGFEAVRNGATRPLHSFLFWAPLFSVTLPLPLLFLARDPLALEKRRVLYVCALPAFLLLLWAAAVVFGGYSLADAVSDRGWNWLTTCFLMGGLVGCVLALWRSLDGAAAEVSPPSVQGRRESSRGSRSRRFALEVDAESKSEAGSPPIADPALPPILVMMTTAFLLILGGELFYVRDIFGSRLNTVFKLSYQAWLLLGVSGAFSLFWLLERWRPAQTGSFQLLRGAWAGTATLLLVAAMLYPASATLSRTEGLAKAGRTLDGLAYVRGESPEDWAAYDWLVKKVDPGERLVEGTGGQYSTASRIAAWSGIPTVIGWAGHEVQWGRDDADLGRRQQDVDRAYSTESLVEALDILQKYDVTYIVVGSLERSKYPPNSLQKFSDLQAPFNSGNTAVYRVPIGVADSAVAP
ncbi:MAG TPA: DUF2298 domain-containing protein [Dehalococcoidia bacterium]|nr:DUF2298 domain-containing protein [Dehalococcoidia bacterium]